MRTLRDHRFSETVDTDDLRGSQLFGPTDDKLGQIADVVFDPNSGRIAYAVIDTGGWLSSRKFIVPSDHVWPCDERESDYRTDLNRAWIERFPPYEESLLDTEETWQAYEERYRSSWLEEPLQSQSGGTPNITPANEAAAKVTSDMRRRWVRFEEKLKQTARQQESDVA